MPNSMRRTHPIEPAPWPEGEVGAEPWLRWPGEQPHEYYAFCAFRDLPAHKRDIRNAAAFYRTGDPDAEAKARGPVPHKWRDLLIRFRWSERAEAKDRHSERQHLKAMDDAVSAAYREMGDRHAREAMALQAKGIERLRLLDPMSLNPDQVLRFILQSAHLERLARGASLQDLQQAQRERDQTTTTIQYVDDWRGDQQRLERLKKEGSRYGNGQGVLPSDAEEARAAREAPGGAQEEDGGVTITRANGHQPNAEAREWFADRVERPLDDNPWQERD